MRSLLRQLLYQFRYILPIWLAQLLTNWLPENRITIRLRGMFVSPFLGQCGKNLQLARSVHFLNPHGISIGRDVYLATGCWIDGIGGLTIDDEVKLSPYVVVTTSSHCFKNDSVRFGGSMSSPTRIGKGSWLAAHVVVAAGVSIGSGVVVGGNSVVSRNLPDNVFAAGAPAKTIGPRVDKEATLFSRMDLDRLRKEGQ
jgi:acetyltransferase-like isoleucine patch superfamily enzyme